jgi:MOB kinase activator 1
MSAPQYMENLFDWVGSQLDDSSVFPQNFGAPFPPTFKDTVQTIFKRLFRVYGHLYHCHFRQVCDLGMQKHLNTSAKHFVMFALEYELIDKKELAPLQDLIEKWFAHAGA